MTENFLQLEKIAAAIDQMAGESVPEIVKDNVQPRFAAPQLGLEPEGLKRAAKYVPENIAAMVLHFAGAAGKCKWAGALNVPLPQDPS